MVSCEIWAKKAAASLSLVFWLPCPRKQGKSSAASTKASYLHNTQRERERERERAKMGQQQKKVKFEVFWEGEIRRLGDSLVEASLDGGAIGFLAALAGGIVSVRKEVLPVLFGDDLPHILSAGEIDLGGKGGVRNSGVRLRGLRGLDLIRLLSRLDGAGGSGGIEGLAGGAVAAPGGGIGSGARGEADASGALSVGLLIGSAGQIDGAGNLSALPVPGVAVKRDALVIRAGARRAGLSTKKKGESMRESGRDVGGERRRDEDGGLGSPCRPRKRRCHRRRSNCRRRRRSRRETPLSWLPGRRMSRR